MSGAPGRVLRVGADPAGASCVLLLVHGRGATPEGILELGRRIAPPDAALVAPAAEGGSWYPSSFLEPLERNEPWLSRSLGRLETLVTDLEDRGAPPERVVLLGFSQGACLSVEYAARHARRYRAVAALSGGLIGPPGRRWDYEGTLEETPIFFGCSDRDPHVPAVRVHESADALTRMGADVVVKIYPGLGHAVNDDEVEQVRALLAPARDT